MIKHDIRRSKSVLLTANLGEGSFFFVQGGSHVDSCMKTIYFGRSTLTVFRRLARHSANLACKRVTETMLDGMPRHIPNKRLPTRRSGPSRWTPECTAAVQAKWRSWDRLHKYSSKENEDLYKTQCARGVACLHNAKEFERGLAAVPNALKANRTRRAVVVNP